MASRNPATFLPKVIGGTLHCVCGGILKFSGRNQKDIAIYICQMCKQHYEYPFVERTKKGAWMIPEEWRALWELVISAAVLVMFAKLLWGMEEK